MSAAGAGRVVIAVVQMAMDAAPERNLGKARAAVREAAAAGASLVLLPELFRSRYFCQSEDAACFGLAEPVPGPTTETLAELAEGLDVAIVAGLFERRAAGVYHNTAALIDGARGYVGKYRKMHIPDDPRFYEKFYFTPGDLGFKCFGAGGLECGVLICWDQWYPEAARLTAMLGAEILLYPTAIGWHPEEKESAGAEQHAAWETMQRSHAIANGCFVAAANRVGFEPGPDGGGVEFWGRSFVAAPDGRIIARAPADAEAVLTVEIDRAEIERARQGWPFFRDRRIDAYGGLTSRFLDPSSD